MNIEELGNLIPDGRMVHARFIGRTDGKEHEVIGRVGVGKHTSGGQLKFDPIEKGLIHVFGWSRDEKGRFVTKGYRFIPADTLISIKSAGITYNGNGEIISS